MTTKPRNHVIQGVKEQTLWWVGQRREKLEKQLTGSMSVNPFLWPFLFEYHDLPDLEALVDLIVGSHLMTGHNTGFGKLVDEKILPRVFDTIKLDKKFRTENHPYGQPHFDEIDHIVPRKHGGQDLLSLKAGKWTIQLSMAVQLNTAFKEILSHHGGVFSKIVVGVFYGKNETLTDKYDILRGINRGANHDVEDLRDRVEVKAGRRFWAWLNGGEAATQEWVLAGMEAALQESNIREDSKRLIGEFRTTVAKKYEDVVASEDGQLTWGNLLTKING